MGQPLSAAQRAEIADLARRFGEPLRRDAEYAKGFRDPVAKRDRVGEVCMVIRRPNGRLLLSIKTFYPRGAHRLPTGGLKPDEGILEGLLRETHEETGLETATRRFLAVISYRPKGQPDQEPTFHTFAFLLDELSGTLGPLDESEEIEEYREVALDELPVVARTLESIAPERAKRIDGDWADWGAFRAVVHRVVHEALTTRR